MPALNRGQPLGRTEAHRETRRRASRCSADVPGGRLCRDGNLAGGRTPCRTVAVSDSGRSRRAILRGGGRRVMPGSRAEPWVFSPWRAEAYLGGRSLRRAAAVRGGGRSRWRWWRTTAVACGGHGVRRPCRVTAVVAGLLAGDGRRHWRAASVACPRRSMAVTESRQSWVAGLIWASAEAAVR